MKIKEFDETKSWYNLDKETNKLYLNEKSVQCLKDNLSWSERLLVKIKHPGNIQESYYIDLNELSEIKIEKILNCLKMKLTEQKLRELVRQVIKEVENKDTVTINGKEYDKNITELDLSFNQLNTLPPEIGKLSNLRKLVLSFNQLTALPSEIIKLKKLKNLGLTENRLNNLPPEIYKLIDLKELYLSHNQLNNLSPEIGNLRNLKELYLSHNQLNNLSPEIGKLSNLEILNLRGNKLSTLPKEIGQLSNLKYLYLINNNFSEVEKRKIEQWLPNCKIKFE